MLNPHGTGITSPPELPAATSFRGVFLASMTTIFWKASKYLTLVVPYQVSYFVTREKRSLRATLDFTFFGIERET